MRILLGADQYPEYINGAANFTTRLATGLAASGHTVDVLWPSADGQHLSSHDHGVRVHRLSSIALPGRPRMQVCTPRVVSRQIDQILAVARPEVVHVQSHLSLGRSLLRAARAAGVPALATNHFMPENLVPHVPLVRRFPGLASRLAWRDLERVFSEADLLTAPTSRAVDLLADATDLPRAEVVSCGVDLARYAQLARTLVRQEPTVLFVGRLEHEKHVAELMGAFARLPVALGARLEIVGMGSLRPALEALAQTLGIARAITFAGAISDQALLEAYARADLFVMPGTAELQSLATLEAMAAGLPVVAANAMALPHLVHDAENGYLYDPGDVDGLTARMNTLLANPLLRTRFGRTSRRIAEQHSLTSTLATFVYLYGRLIRARQLDAVGTDDDLAMAS